MTREVVIKEDGVVKAHWIEKSDGWADTGEGVALKEELAPGFVPVLNHGLGTDELIDEIVAVLM